MSDITIKDVRRSVAVVLGGIAVTTGIIDAALAPALPISMPLTVLSIASGILATALAAVELGENEPSQEYQRLIKKTEAISAAKHQPLKENSIFATSMPSPQDVANVANAIGNDLVLSKIPNMTAPVA